MLHVTVSSQFSIHWQQIHNNIVNQYISVHLTQGNSSFLFQWYIKCCMWMSRCKLSPASSVMWDCAVRSLNATFIVAPFPISSAHNSPLTCMATHIFSSKLNFVLIVSALVFFVWATWRLATFLWPSFVPKGAMSLCAPHVSARGNQSLKPSILPSLSQTVLDFWMLCTVCIFF